ncbi:MAG: sporulation protein YunB [Clostridia bacterium]|nr:sporulation protein YunB [Clostridia bacterium]
MKCKKKGKLILVLLIIILSIYAILSYFATNVSPIITKLTSSKIKSISLRALSVAVTSVISEEITYEDLMGVIRNSEGEVRVMQAHTDKINLLARQISAKANENIKNAQLDYVTIPIGAFSGSMLLSGLGPEIHIKVVPITNINCDYISEFSSAGVNQTLHKIYVNLRATIQLVIPTIKEIEVNSKVLISECLIVGKIPNTYLNSTSLENMMDLIPESG